MLRSLIERELSADQAANDVTTQLLDDKGKHPAKAAIRAKEHGVFSGVEVCKVFQEVTGISVLSLMNEGQAFESGQTVVELKGTVSRILTSERTLLNLLSHSCGIASKTASFVQAIGKQKTKLLATRKTLPGQRVLQLMAVVAGGGHIHRTSLQDGILIKENHQAQVPVEELLNRAFVRRSPLHGIEVEVQDLKTLQIVMKNPPDVIMLDNFSLDEIEAALKIIGGRARTEVSGGVGLENIRAIAKLGVDYISVGQLTHSVKAIDLSLDFL